MKTSLFIPIFFLFPFCVQAQNADSLAVTRQVDSLQKIWRGLNGNRNYQEMLEIATFAGALAEKGLGKHSPYYAKCLNAQGLALFEMGRLAEAEILYLEAKDIWEKSLGKQHSDYFMSVTNLANLYTEMGKYENAEQLYLEVIAFREKALGKEHPQYATSLNSLATLYTTMGNYEKAEQLYLEAIAIRGKNPGKEHPDYAASLNNLANLYTKTGTYEKVEPLLLESIAILEKTLGQEHPNYSASIINLADLYSIMGDYEKSEQRYLEAKALLEKALAKEKSSYTACLNGLANLYGKMGNYEKAEPLYLEAIAIREKKLGKEHSSYAESLHNLAVLYFLMGNYEKSEPLFLESKAIWEKNLGKEHPRYSGSLDGLADLYNRMGNYEKAEQLYLESIAIREKSLGKEHPLYASSLNNLANLYEIQNRFMASEPLLAELYAQEQARLSKAASYFSEREIANYIATFKTERYNLCDYLLTRSSGDKQTGTLPALAFDQILFYKGFLLTSAARLNTISAASPESKELNIRLKGYRRRLAAEYAKPIAERKGVDELEEKANTAEKELTRTLTGYADATRQVTWKEVQSLLKPDEAAIEFIHFRYLLPNPTDSIVYAALVQRPSWDAPRWIPLFEQKQLETLLDKGNNRIANHINTLYAGNLLYEFIWQPLEKELAGIKTIYFSPSGLLHRLNLNAIPIPQTRETLADRYHLVTLSSTRQLVTDQPDTATAIATATATATVFGGIRYDMDSTAIRQANISISGTRGAEELPFAYTDSTLRDDCLRSFGGDKDGWKYLPWTAVEAISVAEILETHGIQTQTLQGYAATEEYFKSLGQPGGEPSPRILHVATHGYFFPDPNTKADDRRWTMDGNEPVFKISDHPMIRSGLIMAGANRAWTTGRGLDNADDGVLTAYEISQLDLSNTELVVLSACETGLGDIQGNEGVYGLQRAFKIAGAKYLIMSLWQVPDYATQELMTLFYTNWLEEKMNIPDAFRAAQQQMREKFPNPFDWAGFVLVE